ncbi:MAG: hypothetical protein J6K13_05055 [Clostridia bacterium]|nr:hypothetical protein [Clostridia bacterium]
MDEQKLRGMMGLTVRARQAVFGEDGCLKTIRSGNCGVLLLDSGASPATKKKYHDACTNAGATLGIIPEGMLLEATSRPGMAMAVLKGGLAQQITRLLQAADPIQSANNCGGASVE